MTSVSTCAGQHRWAAVSRPRPPTDRAARVFRLGRTDGARRFVRRRRRPTPTLSAFPRITASGQNLCHLTHRESPTNIRQHSGGFYGGSILREVQSKKRNGKRTRSADEKRPAGPPGRLSSLRHEIISDPRREEASGGFARSLIDSGAAGLPAGVGISLRIHA